MYSKDTYPEDFIPTIFDDIEKKEMIDDKEVLVSIWDTSYDRSLRMCYHDTDVSFIVFSVVDGNSFDQVKSKWESGKFIE